MKLTTTLPANISILLPTRGRKEMLKESVESLIDHAQDPTKIEFLLAFDNDDAECSQYFVDHIAPMINQVGGQYRVYEFARLGYHRLHEYLNCLARYAKADWWVFWNDDAVMVDHAWDTEILKQQDRFCVQAFDTHNSHPYSIFPIVPRAWYEVLGHLSRHALNDAYISQIAWLLDIMVRIPIKVEHRRFDLTGKNNDQTFADRRVWDLEGNIQNPRDFNHISQRRLRNADVNKLAQYLGTNGYDMSFWNEVALKKRDPWEKMLAADINKQMMRLP